MSNASEVTPLTRRVQISGGKTLELQELNVLDWGDLEDFIGCSTEELLHDTAKLKRFRAVAFLAWLMARKVGRSADQQAKRDWAVSFEAFQVGLRMVDLNTLSEEVISFFAEVVRATLSDSSSAAPDSSASATGSP